MTTPGWYNDERDAGLARWHDGRDWTAHTLVIAEWTGANSPPPPPGDVLTAVDDDPTAWSFDDESWDDAAPAPRHSAGPAAGRDWRRLAAPAGVLGALILALLAFSLVKDDGADTKDLDAQETSAFGDIDDAVTAARRGLAAAITVSNGDLKVLIRGLCDAADGGSTDAVAQDAALAVTSVDQLQPVLAGAARGAASYCPAATSVGGAIDEVVAAAAIRLGVFDTTLPDGSLVDPAAVTPGTSSSKAGATTQPTTKASESGVKRTETRQQSSTGNDSVGNNDTTSGDVVEEGNKSKQSHTITTSITAPPTTASTTPPSSVPETTETSAP